MAKSQRRVVMDKLSSSVVVYISIRDKRKSQINEYSDPFVTLAGSHVGCHGGP